jgi:nitrogen fixation negative regulator NifL
MTDKRTEMPNRGSDALTYEEKRFQIIFQHSAVSLWEEDISALRSALEMLRARGVIDIARYIEENPAFLREAARMITVVDVNEATLALYEVGDRQQLLGPLDRTLDLDDSLTLESLRDDVLLIASGGTKLERESKATTPSGKKLDILITLSVPAPNDAYSHMLVNVQDITRRKHAERELRESEQRYREMFIAAQRQAKELELLNQVRTALMREFELTEVIRTVVEGIAATFGYTHVSIYFLEEETLTLKHQVGYTATIKRIPISQGVSGRVARTGQPVLIQDVRADSDFIGAIDGVHSELCIPLFDQARVVGILNVESTKGDRLAEADLKLMTALGELVSIAIVRARLYADLRQDEERYRSLVENLGEGIAIVDPSETFLFVNPAAEKVFGVSRGSLTGQNLGQFVSEEEFQRVLAETEKRRRGETSTFEQQILRPDGTFRWIELTATPKYDQAGAFSHTFGIFRDITESKVFERHLRESEERFRQLGEAALEGIAITQKGIVVDGNVRLATMLGYDLREMIGKPVLDFIAPDSQALVANHIAENYSRPYEHSLRRKDGSSLLVESHARMITWDGKPMRVTGLLDISERRHAQDQLLKLSLAVSQSPASIVITDLQGNIEYVNPKFTQITGYSSEEALGKNPRILKTGETPPEQYRRLWETITAGREWRGEFHNRKKNGELFWETASISPVKNAGDLITHFVAVKEDVTDRKQAEELLRQGEERYRLMFEFAPLAINITRGLAITYANRSYLRLFGFSSLDELQKVPLLELFAPESRPQIKENIQRRAEGLSVPDAYETNCLRKDGTRFPILMYLTMAVFADGPAVVAFIMDITEQKRDEKEKAKLQEQLTQAQKMESVGRLAGGIAHDFNNMLGVILGHTELALERTDSTLPLHSDLTEIRKAAERSAALTRGLLAFARKQAITPRTMDLNETVEGMLKMLERLIGENVHLRWKPKADLWPVKVDPSQVNQILANLCVNARDAITDFGEIIIETGNVIVDETYCATHAGLSPGEYVLLAVSDDGCGISKEILSHLFEPFFTTKGIGKGTGLGLATVYGIVKQNNGFVNVYSEIDRGTSFTIYLPRDARSRRAQTEETSGPSKRGQETILLVEDEPALLRLTAQMLERSGYTVLVASTPGEAIRLAREHLGQVHMLMTDVIMPEMNGRELAKNLLSIYPHVKRLFTSGYTAEVIAHHGVLDEGVQFIQKPFSAEELANKVREALETE